MSLDELLALRRTLEFEEFGSVALRRAWVTSEQLGLLLEVYPGVHDHSQIWKVSCDSPVRYSIGGVPCSGDDLSVVEDHVLLWEHSDTWSRLGFLGSPQDAFAVIGALALCHERVAGPWIPLSRYLRIGGPSSAWLARLLQGGHGFLASGPERLIQAYGQVLTEYGIEPYYIGSHSPYIHANDVPGANRDVPLRALLFPGGYVIGTAFGATHDNGSDLL